MVYTQSDWEKIKSSFISHTDEELLALYRDVRLQLSIAMQSEHGTVFIEIRQRRHSVSDPAGLLDLLTKLIASLEDKIHRRTNGPSRNYAQLGKPR